MRHWTTVMLTIAASVLIALPVTAQMKLDLNLAPGDQGERERHVKPGERVSVELVATSDAAGMIGFEVELRFDPQKVEFKGFNASGLMAGAMSMPPRKSDTGVTVNAAILGGRKAEQDAGSLGQLLFQVSEALGQGAKIDLVKGSYGDQAGANQFNLDGGILLVNPDAGPPPGDAGSQQPPAGSQIGGQPPQPPQPPSGHDPQGFQNPNRGQRSRLGGRGRGSQPPQGFQPPQGGGAPQGFQPPPGGGAPQGFQPPQGGMGGHGGPGRGPGDPGQEGPDPEQIIRALPESLQPAFERTLQTERASHKEHVAAELKVLKSVRMTLEETKRFLVNASDQDKMRVGRALMFFDRMGGEDDRGGPGRRRGSRGQTGGPPNVDAKLDGMIQEVENEIRHLEHELETM